MTVLSKRTVLPKPAPGLLIVALCFVIGASLMCNRGVSSRLPGIWVVEDNPTMVRMEFFKNGTVVTNYEAEVSLSGTWKESTDSSVEITMESWQMTGCLRNNHLVLKYGNEEKSYCRYEQKK